jgi:hypothetical protein
VIDSHGLALVENQYDVLLVFTPLQGLCALRSAKPASLLAIVESKHMFLHRAPAGRVGGSGEWEWGWGGSGGGGGSAWG